MEYYCNNTNYFGNYDTNSMLMFIRYSRRAGSLYFQIHVSIKYSERSEIYEITFSNMLVNEDNLSSYIDTQKTYYMSERQKKAIKELIESDYTNVDNFEIMLLDIQLAMLGDF